MNRPRPITREDQRKLTRRRIIDAARTCFYEEGVAEVSVERIARVAEVGRATLYLHFPNKDAILLELLSINLAAVRKIFAELCALKKVDLASVSRWMKGYIDTLRSHRDAMRLVHIGIATTGEARTQINEHHLTLAKHITERFAGASDGTAKGHARLMLMIARIDYFAGAAAEASPHIDVEAGLELVGRELVDLLSDDKAL
jgi:AcrR family transcriptional regulator